MEIDELSVEFRSGVFFWGRDKRRLLALVLALAYDDERQWEKCGPENAFGVYCVQP